VGLWAAHLGGPKESKVSLGALERYPGQDPHPFRYEAVVTATHAPAESEATYKRVDVLEPSERR
jgi:hypothetical protein